ncbi:hypothetical protein DFH08DRAFT_898477, partial [Mycena albidolilacea]
VSPDSSGPIFRALSRTPSMPPPKRSGSPPQSSEMTLVSELPPPQLAAIIPSSVLRPNGNPRFAIFMPEISGDIRQRTGPPMAPEFPFAKSGEARSDDATMSELSPLTSTSSEHDMDLDSEVQDTTASPSPTPHLLRRSSRDTTKAPQPGIAAKNDSRLSRSSPQKNSKRKASQSGEAVVAVKKAKKRTAVKSHTAGVDTQVFNHSNWPLGILNICRLKRSKTVAKIIGILPDGQTERTFDYRLHEGSEKAEYRLIFDINQSMARVRERCTTASGLFRENRCGDIIWKPAVNGAHLCRVPATDWDSMPDVERVKLWGTGTDLFTLGKEAGPRTTDIRAQVVRNNAMGTPLQVQVPDDDDDVKADYTEAIRRTTLREVLSHAERSDGLVLNALDLPGGHFIHPNPLLGTGLDLENVAYCQTNGLPGFETKYPKYEEMYWKLLKLLALAHAFSYFHFDICTTWVYVSGPGEKFWIRSHPRTTANSHDPTAFENWQPDHASIQDCDYEVVVLPAGSGILLQQPGREHTVIHDGRSDFARTATWTVGGYFFCASSIRPAMSVTLHMVMVQHLLTNADHFPMWPIFIRVNMFWLNVTSECPKAELDSLAAYCPDLGDARGWIDITDLSCMVVLFPAPDLRRYGGTGTPKDELSEAEFTSAKYVSWRKWVASKYRGFGASHKELDWERDIFSLTILCIAFLVTSVAVTLYHYHRRRSNKDSEVEVFRTFTSKAFASAISDALYSYDQKLVKQFQTKIDASEPLGSTHFFLFEDKELYFKAL